MYWVSVANYKTQGGHLHMCYKSKTLFSLLHFVASLLLLFHSLLYKLRPLDGACYEPVKCYEEGIFDLWGFVKKYATLL